MCLAACWAPGGHYHCSWQEPTQIRDYCLHTEMRAQDRPRGRQLLLTKITKWTESNLNRPRQASSPSFTTGTAHLDALAICTWESSLQETYLTFDPHRKKNQVLLPSFCRRESRGAELRRQRPGAVLWPLAFRSSVPSDTPALPEVGERCVCIRSPGLAQPLGDWELADLHTYSHTCWSFLLFP